MKLSYLAGCFAIATVLTGCATLADGLQKANETLGQVTSSMPSTSGSGKSYTIGNKSTSQYEIRNLKLTEEQISDVTNIRFSGQAYNKTNQRMTISISVPVYNKQGFYASEVQTTVTIPPKEKTLIDGINPFALRDGQKLNTQKTSFDVTLY